MQNKLLLASNIAPTIIKEREEEQVYHFFMGLNDFLYGTVRSSIIQEEPIPKVKTVFQKICQEERHLNLARTATSEEVGGARIAFTFVKSLNTASPISIFSSQKPSCTHCLKASHGVTNSYKLVGFPEWWARDKFASSSAFGLDEEEVAILEEEGKRFWERNSWSQKH